MCTTFLQISLPTAWSQVRTSIITLFGIHTLCDILPQPLLQAKILIANCSKLFPLVINPISLQMLTLQNTRYEPVGSLSGRVCVLAMKSLINVF